MRNTYDRSRTNEKEELRQTKFHVHTHKISGPKTNAELRLWLDGGREKLARRRLTGEKKGRQLDKCTRTHLHE